MSRVSHMASSRDQTTIASLDTEGGHYTSPDDFENAYKGSDFPSISLGTTPSRMVSMTNLRIKTFSEPDPHDRYLSSEEEPSPSPDSDTVSDYYSEEVVQGTQSHPEDSPTNEKKQDESSNAQTEHCQAEIAVAVPIVAMGRPKLIDITNLAPMHKRRRTSSEKMTLARTAITNAASKVSNRIAPSNASRTPSAPEPDQAVRTEDTKVSAPASWLPEVDEVAVEDCVPPYRDYDPISRDRPKLPPRKSHAAPNKRPGSVARARHQASNSSLKRGSPLRSSGRSTNMTIRKDVVPMTRQLNKKPKMLPRGLTGRSEPLVIPPFRQ